NTKSIILYKFEYPYLIYLIILNAVFYLIIIILLNNIFIMKVAILFTLKRDSLFFPNYLKRPARSFLSIFKKLIGKISSLLLT
ncbi:hypothetical protein QBC46DRAFT_272180, partial [Diplogelasinospora grovesii]